MLFLRTGLPGAGKTLNTIKEIDEEHQVDPSNPNLRLYKDPDNPNLPPRVIYYFGIPELKVDKLKSKWVEFNTPDEWFKLPDGSVIVIDECQRVFGTDVRTRVPKITEFETHRHHGFDIHIITQHPSLVCSAARALVGKHINFIRPYGRTKGVFRHEYEMCIPSPERRSNFKMAQESKIEFDSHYFGLYKSSTVHTHKKVTPSFVKMMPLIIILTLIPIGILGAGVWYITHKKGPDSVAHDNDPKGADAPSPDGHAVKAVDPSQVPSHESGRSVSVKQYTEQFKPRISELQATAPRYDEVNKPHDFPRPTCLTTEDPALVSTAKNRGINVGSVSGQKIACQCYSQQMTRMQTSFEFCVDVAQNGYFDDTKQQPQIASGQNRGLSSRVPETSSSLRRGPAAVGETAAQSTGNFHIVSDDEFPGRPWR